MQIILSGALIGSKIQKINPTSKVGGNLKETHMYRKKCRRLEIAMVGRRRSEEEMWNVQISVVCCIFRHYCFVQRKNAVLIPDHRIMEFFFFYDFLMIF